MSGGNRLYHVAVRGWLIAVVLGFVAALASDAGDNPSKAAPRDHATPQQAQPVDKPPPPQQGADASQYESLCKAAQSTEERDLCQQWRMAEAANKQAQWTKRQFFATVAEIMALVLTIGVGSWAAVGATRAASATEKAVEVASDTAQRELRAYISLDGGKITIQDDLLFVCNLTFKNYGQTPAYDVQSWATIERRQLPLAGDSGFPRTTKPPMSKSIVGPGSEFHKGPAHPVNPAIETADKIADGMQRGSIGLFVWGETTYKDAFHRRWKLTFRHMNGARQEDGSFRLVACADGNDESEQQRPQDKGDAT